MVSLHLTALKTFNCAFYCAADAESPRGDRYPHSEITKQLSESQVNKIKFGVLKTSYEIVLFYVSVLRFHLFQ